MKKLFIISIFAFIFTSCSSDSDDTMEPPIKDVTYVKNIKSIIDGNCISCHASTPNNGAPMSLVTLANVKEAIKNRDLIGRVSNGSMPTGAGSVDLTPAQIQMIKDWETNSFK